MNPYFEQVLDMEAREARNTNAEAKIRRTIAEARDPMLRDQNLSESRIRCLVTMMNDCAPLAMLPQRHEAPEEIVRWSTNYAAINDNSEVPLRVKLRSVNKPRSLSL